MLPAYLKSDFKYIKALSLFWGQSYKVADFVVCIPPFEALSGIFEVQ